MPDRPTLVCAVDESPRERPVAQVVRWLAQALDARVLLTHVFDPMVLPVPPTGDPRLTMTSDDLEQRARQRARLVLAELADALGDVDHTELLVEGDVSAEILRLVRAHGPRLLVTGSAARRPLERILQGSVSARLVVQAGCPVVVVPDDARLEADGPVLAAYDGSEPSRRAARHGAALAAGLGRDLVLVHVAEPGEPTVEADAALALDLHDAVGPATARRLDVTVSVEHGDPVGRLVQSSAERGASLVVVGSRGRNAVSAALLGSVSAGMVRMGGRPVVVAGPKSGSPSAPSPA